MRVTAYNLLKYSAAGVVAVITVFFPYGVLLAQVSNVTVPVPGEVIPESSTGVPQLFFDARTTGFTRDGKQQIFDGDVIAIGPKSIITADRVTVDQQNRSLIAEGHVVILAADQILTGEKIEYSTETNDFRIVSARMIVNDKVEADRIAKDVLGFSAPELNFEADRKARLDEVAKNKDEVKSDVRRKAKMGQGASDSDIRDYARYLQQEELIRGQENPAFAHMTESRRNNLRKRRDFWEKSRVSERVQIDPSRQSYFRLEGDELLRTNVNDYRAKHSLWTPCRCEKDESPAWGVRASSTEAQMGGYATFYDAMLEVKGVPVLYLPWLMLPIKDRRQSGLLMPSFTDDVVSGSGYSQPLFIDLGKDKDITLRGDVYERRGIRAGAEVRWRKTEYSGFQLNVEGMRDRVWTKQRALRAELADMYTDGLPVARSQASGAPPDDLAAYYGRDYSRHRLAQRDWWEANAAECLSPDPNISRQCEERVLASVRAPENANRGLARWRGYNRFGDRLSFVTSGELYSDRQYNSDLYIADSTQPGFDTGSGEWSINPIRSRVNYDGSNYFLGLGSYFGDSTMLNDRFEGYQMPWALHAKTRWYPLKSSGLPVYWRGTLDDYRITRDAGNSKDPENSLDWMPGGYWHRAEGAFVAPLTYRTAVQVDHFTDLEARFMSFDGSQFHGRNNDDSGLQSWRTGVRFLLPIDGKGVVPDWLGGFDDESGRRLIQHVMNWSMTLATRPMVHRWGPYGRTASLSAGIPSSWFATDRPGIDDNIQPTDFMKQYQIVTFSTSQRWKIFSELWKTLYGEQSAQKASDDARISFQEKARRELLYTLDRPVRGPEDIFSNDQSKWFVNRYQLLDTDYIEPVSFSAAVSYDRLNELKRAEEGRTRDNRPWSEVDSSLSLAVSGWTLTGSSKYNIYDKLQSKFASSVMPPALFNTNLSLGYTIERSPYQKQAGEIGFASTRESSLMIVTSLTNPITTSWSFSEKEIESESVTHDYRQKLGVNYSSPSGCWGLGFVREKPYGSDERAATYLLQLNVTFMGQTRDLPNMSTPLERQIKNG